MVKIAIILPAIVPIIVIVLIGILMRDRIMKFALILITLIICIMTYIYLLFIGPATVGGETGFLFWTGLILFEGIILPIILIVSYFGIKLIRKFRSRSEEY